MFLYLWLLLVQYRKIKRGKESLSYVPYFCMPDFFIPDVPKSVFFFCHSLWVSFVLAVLSG